MYVLSTHLSIFLALSTFMPWQKSDSAKLHLENTMIDLFLRPTIFGLPHGSVNFYPKSDWVTPTFCASS